MLTDIKVKTAKPTDKAYRLPDSGGLHLFVTTTGSRLWRMRYKLPGGTEKLLSFGAYPAVSLANARKARDAAREVLRRGGDPATVRRATATSAGGITFEELAKEWYRLQSPRWAARHAGDVIDSLTTMVFPTLGDTPVADITVPAVLEVLRAIEARPAIETARRVRQRMSAVFVYGIATGRAKEDPALVVKGAMAPLIRGRQPALTSIDEVRDILKRADETPSMPITRAALKLIALTAVRPGEIRGATWSEFDINAAEWRIPASRMKMKREHIVPLSTQALAVLAPLDKTTPFLFPNTRHPLKPMSENAIGYLLNRAGFHGQHVPHGWRSAFSTIMNERFPADYRVIDLMLAHSAKDRVEAAYNRSLHIGRRRELAQIWADLLMPDLRADPPGNSGKILGT